MNIELKQAAQDAAEAIDWLLKNIRLDAPQLSGKAMGNAEKCASALRTALSQQPATATACGIPGMAKTTCPYCEQGFAFEQPATSEPVVSRNPFASRCYTMSESHLSGHRLIVGFEKLGDAQDAHEWVARQGRGDFTHPAPSAPGDAARDAERYRWLKQGCSDKGTKASHIAENLYGFEWDEAIDAAMLAAKKEKP